VVGIHICSLGFAKSDSDKFSIRRSDPARCCFRWEDLFTPTRKQQISPVMVCWHFLHPWQRQQNWHKWSRTRAFVYTVVVHRVGFWALTWSIPYLIITSTGFWDRNSPPAGLGYPLLCPRSEMNFGVLVRLRGNHSDQLRIFYLIHSTEKDRALFAIEVSRLVIPFPISALSERWNFCIAHQKLMVSVPFDYGVWGNLVH